MPQEPNRYGSALHLLGSALQQMDQKKDPGLWTMCSGLVQFAKALQQDMEELKAKIAAIDSDVKGLR